MARKLLLTGAAGYVADQILPAFRDRYDLVLVDVTGENRRGEPVEGVTIADLVDAGPDGCQPLFEGVEAVLHLGRVRRTGDALDHYYQESRNVAMAYNVLRCAYEAGAARVVVASSNHAADWYEHSLIHRRRMDMLDPYMLPLSDNFYGWSKASYEHLGFLFAAGMLGRRSEGGVDRDVGRLAAGRRVEVVMVRIGAPRELDLSAYRGDAAHYKRDLGAYISPRDLTQLFVKAIETPDIENEHGVPWQVVYGISDNTRAFWSLANARRVLGYEPDDDSEVKYAEDIRSFLAGDDEAGPGRVGPV